MPVITFIGIMVYAIFLGIIIGCTSGAVIWLAIKLIASRGR